MHEIIPTVTIADKDDLTLTVLYSPFDVTQRESCQLIFGYGKTIADYLGELADDKELLVCHNGEFLDHSLFALRFPRKGDHIIIAAQSFGKGDDESKGVFASLAMIVVSAVAIAAGQGWATMMFEGGALAGGITEAVVGGLIAGTITAAGGYVISKLFNIGDDEESKERSATYGFGKPQTSIAQGNAVPIIYGEHYTGGSIVAKNISLIPDSNDERLTMLVALSEGEIYDVTDVRVNDHPVDTYDDVSWDFSKGGLDETISHQRFAPQIRQTLEIARKLSTDWLPIALPSGVNHVEGIVNFPRGLAKINREKSTERNHASVAIEVQYRKKNDSAWTDAALSPVILSASDYTQAKNRKVVIDLVISKQQGQDTTSIRIYRKRSTSEDWEQVRYDRFTTTTQGVMRQQWIIAEDDGKRYQYKHELETLNGLVALTSVTYSQYIDQTLNFELKTVDSVRFGFVANIRADWHDDDYEIQFRRTTEEYEDDPDATEGWRTFDEAWVSSVEAVSTLAVQHRGTAMLYIDMKASDQLSSIPNILAKVKGKIVNIYDRKGKVIGTQWSNNPAWIALDIMLEFGKMLPNRIHFSAFVDWSKFCITNSLTFNGVFDSTSTIWDILQKVFRAGLAQANPLGAKFSLIIHQPRNPTMLFTSSNIIEGSYASSWSSNANRSNIFEGEYYDIDNYNERTMLKIIDPDVNEQDRAQRPAKIGLMGVTNTTQAEKLLGVYRAMNKYLIMSMSFDAYLDSIACTIGDVIRVQQDHVQWGKSWRTPVDVIKGATVIECDISEESINENAAYFMAHYPLMPLAIRTVESFSSITDEITIAPIDEWQHIHFVQVNGVGEYIRVDYTYMENEKLRLVIGSNESVAAGNSITLIQGDGTFKSAITAANGTEITLAEPLPMPLTRDGLLAIGQSSVVAKDFIVTSISGNGEFMRKISGVEYNESLFILDGEYDYVAPTTEIKLLTPVQNPNIAEEMYRDGNQIRSKVKLSWQPSLVGDYYRAKIVVKTDRDSNGRVIWSQAGINVVEIDALANNETLTATITAIDILGRACPTAVVVDYTAVAQQSAPSAVKNVAMTRGFAGVIIDWEANQEIDVVGYQVRVGYEWSDAEILVQRTDTTRAVLEVSKIGNYSVLVKAIDALGIMSNVASAANYTVVGPTAVTGFSAIQNGRLLVLTWDNHRDPDVRNYIISRGDSYLNSEVIATTSGSTFTYDIDLVDEDTTFWMIPVDHFGLRGNVPVYAKLIYNAFEDHNVVTSIEVSPSWAGDKINMTIDSKNALMGSTKEAVFSYYQRMDTILNEPLRLSLRDYPFAASQSATWKESEMPWASAGNQLWLPNGLADNQRYTRYVSRHLNAYPSTLLEGYDCVSVSSTTNGVKGGVATYTTTFSQAELVRGGTKAMGFTNGRVIFPLKNSASDQLYCSVAIAEHCLLSYKKGSKTETVKLWFESARLVVEQDGVRHYVTRDKTQNGIANCVVNVLARSNDNVTTWDIVIQDENRLLTLSKTTAISGNFDSITISCNHANPATPCGYIRHVRQETQTDVISDESKIEYINSYSRTCDYSHFVRYLSGYYQADLLDVKYLINTDGEQEIGISAAFASLDVPDVFDRGVKKTSASGSVGVSFNRKFLTPPQVVVQISGGSSPDHKRESALPYAYDITNKGFRVVCYKGDNGSSETVAKDVTWQAIGY